MPSDPKQLWREYQTKRVDAKTALEILKVKSLAEGWRYYIGFNTKDGWLEVFKTKLPPKEAPKALSPEEIDAYLLEKNLYLFASKGGWVTIRRVPKEVVEDAERLPDVRSPNEESSV